MAGRLDGRVALISGAARGQGRSHAVRLAQEGADIVAFDVCRQLPTVGYPMATPEDLKETAKQVEDLDRRIIAREADVCDGAAVRALVEEAVAEMGRLDIMSATAGIKGMAGIAHYDSSKHGVVGLMRTLAIELAPHSIRINTVHPTGVNTPMVVNDYMAQFLEEGGDTNIQNLLPVELIEAVDISNAVLWLASDEARYVTGTCLPVDAGFLQ
jgi:NAD(P)-dependent dehydrogenase (short-subunit alcohol dehydrogenase family)